VPPDAVEGLGEYSHVWIVFLFHLNTVPSPNARGGRGRPPAKISPPALGGSKKVGVLATRSPHRFNPIGITLARLDRVVASTAGKGGAASAVLHVSGIDLVDGTPVIDVKPYVPAYDAPPVPPPFPGEHSTGGTAGNGAVRIPEWVGSGLETRRAVTLAEAARGQLRQILLREPEALEFYRDGDVEANARDAAACIEEVLSIDVRSKYQTSKARRGQSRAERAQRLASAFVPSTLAAAAAASDSGNGVVAAPAAPAVPSPTCDGVCYDDEASSICTQQIDNLLVSFRVTAAASFDDDNDKAGGVPATRASRGSGAEDRVTVVAIRRVESFAPACSH
jgi:tRNA-Thr(GGU) m(6)t(6)A37 methyltransferase TsaA